MAREPIHTLMAATYVGGFKDNVKTGQGTKIWGPDTTLAGHKYVGAFSQNEPNGSGNYTYADGSIYTGHFKKGIKNGQRQFNLGT